MKQCGIYGIFNTTNSKVLVGSSVNVWNRWRQHRLGVKKNDHGNPYFQAAWNKYGESCFEFRILEECPENMLLIREDAWMKYYHSMDMVHGYNTKGACRPNPSDESKKKMSVAKKGKPISIEHRRNIGLSRKGTKRSAETIARMSKPRSEQAKQNMRIAQQKRKHLHVKGQVRSEETKRNISEALKARKLRGITSPILGRKIPEELKCRISLAHKGMKASREARLKMSISAKKVWALKKSMNQPVPPSIVQSA